MLNKSRQYFYFIELEIIWCTNKNRLLNEEIKTALHRFYFGFKQTDYRMKTVNIYDDYVHLVIETSPKYEITNILRRVKGVPAKQILRNYPEIRVQFTDSLWDGTSAILTSNENIKEQIAEFLNERRMQNVSD